MPFICVICRDNLSSENEGEVGLEDDITSAESDIIVTTLCGHIFHKSCLAKGFEIAAASGIATGSRYRGNICPTCSSMVSIQNLVRLYPSEIDDEENLRNQREIERLSSELSHMTATNETLQEIIEKLQSRNAARESELHQGSSSSTIPEIKEKKVTQGGLKRGNKVVWLKNMEIPEIGMVKWVGVIGLMDFAGIDFANPIGNDDTFPESRGKVLFPYKKGHGRLVPVRELMLFSDFYD